MLKNIILDKKINFQYLISQLAAAIRVMAFFILLPILFRLFDTEQQTQWLELTLIIAGSSFLLSGLKPILIISANEKDIPFQDLAEPKIVVLIYSILIPTAILTLVYAFNIVNVDVLTASIIFLIVQQIVSNEWNQIHHQLNESLVLLKIQLIAATIISVTFTYFAIQHTDNLLFILCIFYSDRLMVNIFSPKIIKTKANIVGFNAPETKQLLIASIKITLGGVLTNYVLNFGLLSVAKYMNGSEKVLYLFGLRLFALMRQFSSMHIIIKTHVIYHYVSNNIYQKPEIQKLLTRSIIISLVASASLTIPFNFEAFSDIFNLPKTLGKIEIILLIIATTSITLGTALLHCIYPVRNMFFLSGCIFILLYLVLPTSENLEMKDVFISIIFISCISTIIPSIYVLKRASNAVLT